MIVLKRRSFFGTVFAGFVAQWLPRKRTLTHAELNHAYEAAVRVQPNYTFGFTGFKPAQAYRPVVGGQYAADQPMFHSYPMEGGAYKAGDTFSIGRRQLTPTSKRS